MKTCSGLQFDELTRITPSLSVVELHDPQPDFGSKKGGAR